MLITEAIPRSFEVKRIGPVESICDMTKIKSFLG